MNNEELKIVLIIFCDFQRRFSSANKATLSNFFFRINLKNSHKSQP